MSEGIKETNPATVAQSRLLEGIFIEVAAAGTMSGMSAADVLNVLLTAYATVAGVARESGPQGPEVIDGLVREIGAALPEMVASPDLESPRRMFRHIVRKAQASVLARTFPKGSA